MQFRFDLVAGEEIPSVDTPNGRFYTTPTGEVYPSITTILGSQQEKKTIIDSWKQRIGIDKAEGITRQASMRGTIFHKLMENYILDGYVDNTLMPTKKHIFNQLRREVDKSLTVIRGIETPMYSHIIRTAGRTDLVGDWNGITSIIDYKNSERSKRKEWVTDYFLQTTAYSIMFEERTGIAVPNIVVIIGVDEEVNAQVFVENRNKYIDPLLKVIKDYETRNNINPGRIPAIAN